MGYVYSRELGTANGIKFSFDIFKESNTEYRPILTAEDEREEVQSNGMGCSKRRSFETQEEALRFFERDETGMRSEALNDMNRTYR